MQPSAECCWTTLTCSAACSYVTLAAAYWSRQARNCDSFTADLYVYMSFLYLSAALCWLCCSYGEKGQRCLIRIVGSFDSAQLRSHLECMQNTRNRRLSEAELTSTATDVRQSPAGKLSCALIPICPEDAGFAASTDQQRGLQ